MTYQCAPALQQAVFARLAGDADLSALVGASIFDAPPSGAVPDLYVSLGPEEVRDMSDKTGRAAEHRFTITVASDGGSFLAAKEAAAAASAAVTGAPLTLERGRVISLNFERARARRDRSGRRRRIDMRFRAALDDN